LIPLLALCSQYHPQAFVQNILAIIFSAEKYQNPVHLTLNRHSSFLLRENKTEGIPLIDQFELLPHSRDYPWSEKFENEIFTKTPNSLNDFPNGADLLIPTHFNSKLHLQRFCYAKR
jgi:hypothetical protein